MPEAEGPARLQNLQKPNVPNPDIVAGLERYVREQLGLLLAPETNWQPSALLPDMTAPDWHDQVTALRREAAELSDGLLVALVGNMITEEALPSYHAWLTNLEDGFDRDGTEENALALWMRGWVGEEQRHGDVLTKYLYLSGRVDQRAVETTLQHLIRRGFDPHTKNSLYLGFTYTSFQERATQISHGNVAQLARACGATRLGAICEAIAGDEARHERAYTRFAGKLYELDPDGMLLAFEEMMRAGITMPSERMFDGVDEHMYEWFKVVSHRTRMYTAADYAGIIATLVRKWGVAALVPRTPEGRAAQDYVGRLAERVARLAERIEARPPKMPDVPVSWIHGRSLA